MIMLELIESIRQHYDELEDKLKSLELELKAKDKRIKELEAQIPNSTQFETDKEVEETLISWAKSLNSESLETKISNTIDKFDTNDQIRIIYYMLEGRRGVSKIKEHYPELGALLEEYYEDVE